MRGRRRVASRAHHERDHAPRLVRPARGGQDDSCPGFLRRDAKREVAEREGTLPVRRVRVACDVQLKPALQQLALLIDLFLNDRRDVLRTRTLLLRRGSLRRDFHNHPTVRRAVQHRDGPKRSSRPRSPARPLAPSPPRSLEASAQAGGVLRRRVRVQDSWAAPPRPRGPLSGETCSKVMMSYISLVNSTTFVVYKYDIIIRK